MQFTRSFVSPILRCLVPAAAAGMVLTGVAGGESTASAQVVILPLAPPPPRVEVITRAPDRAHFWAPGYWGYEPGYGQRWYPGQWLEYRPGYTWYRPGWSHERDGWAFHNAGWAPGGRGGFGRGWGPR
jgi:hypothetical protein